MKQYLKTALEKNPLDTHLICQILHNGKEKKLAGFIPWGIESLDVFSALNIKGDSILHLLAKSDEEAFKTILTTLTELLKNSAFCERENIKGSPKEFFTKFVNMPNKDEIFPIQVAFEKKAFNVIKQLIKHGADVTVITRDNNLENFLKLLDMALDNKDTEFFKLICFGTVEDIFNNKNVSNNSQVLSNYLFGGHLISDGHLSSNAKLMEKSLSYVINKMKNNHEDFFEIYKVLYSLSWRNYLESDITQTISKTILDIKNNENLSETGKINEIREKFKEYVLISFNEIFKIGLIEISTENTIQVIPNSTVDNTANLAEDATVNKAINSKDQEFKIKPLSYSVKENLSPNSAYYEDKPQLSENRSFSSITTPTKDELVNFANSFKKNIGRDRELMKYVKQSLGEDYSDLHLFILVISENSDYAEKKLKHFTKKYNATHDLKVEFESLNDFFIQYTQALDDQEFINKFSQTQKIKFNAIGLASYLDDLQIVSILLEQTNHYNRSDSSLANISIKFNRKTVLNYMLWEGGLININWQEILNSACKYARYKIIEDYNIKKEKANNIDGVELLNYSLKGAKDLLKIVRQKQKLASQTIIDEKLDKYSTDANSKLFDLSKCIKHLLEMDNFVNEDNISELLTTNHLITSLLKYTKYNKAVVDDIRQSLLDFSHKYKELPDILQSTLNEMNDKWEMMSQSTAYTDRTHYSLASDIGKEQFKDEEESVLPNPSHENLEVLGVTENI